MLEGPVSVCVDRQSLSLDKPFTYLLPGELDAGVGSLVKVPFHGRQVNGWVLGPTSDVPARILGVSKVLSRIRFFDERRLDWLRWISERYVASLASVIERSHPPRVVSEEAGWGSGGWGDGSRDPTPARSPLEPSPHPRPPLLASYRNGSQLLDSVSEGAGEFLHRPAPGEEAACAAEAVSVCLAAGRRSIVLVPEFDPLPATAAAVMEVAGERGILFAGGDKRERYRMWLDMLAGRFEVVVGTRPAVFAPLDRLGLVWISRESHSGHREERSPYYHVRDVSLERARLEGSAVVMSAFCPSLDAAVSGAEEVSPAGKVWPPVEVVAPGPEGRAPRLVASLKRTAGAFLFEPLRGYGVARVCKRCRESAVCAACGGMLRAARGSVTCAVCGALGLCANCGADDFGILRGGAERVEEWAVGITSLPVRKAPPPPGRGEVAVGGSDSVKDIAPPGLDLVGILNADVSAGRPGMYALERTLAVWMEAAAWAGRGGRVIVQTRHPRDASIQALVAGNPARFYRSESRRREEAGFPPGHPVFKVTGTGSLVGEIGSLSPEHTLSTVVGEQTICLVTVGPDDVGAFGRTIRSLAERGVVTRVEAEPHL